MSSTDSGSTDNDEFLQSYLSQIKSRLGDTPVKPNSDADPSLLFSDPESPKTRKIFYTIKQTEAIVNEECAECEYVYRKCKRAPPTMVDRFFGCARLRAEYHACMKRVREDLDSKSGVETLVSLEQFSKLEDKK
ncbi:hypothetical protein IW140_002785 [Coemansia sp. RSA 1813]|nr:hypothetical protein EV178_005449 [Coemansia sp. RSA 1646]KAJ1770266.1 hypothetical protein LPJ74_003327 [Coemansia sp. RSA 1843]KAJ2087527.1 hypothetical protein IW138_004897 [Coemansia sp. RSA 986]KAJ2211507.1 hypothetical protein EV179_005450 [Coemansia sp. RSA 487]KAJ2569897.1 hypothetical protein IW140_002785 [Coemansia sp. RSA 1813]